MFVFKYTKALTIKMHFPHEKSSSSKSAYNIILSKTWPSQGFYVLVLTNTNCRLLFVKFSKLKYFISTYPPTNTLINVLCYFTYIYIEIMLQFTSTKYFIT